MLVQDTEIKEVKLITPKVFGDERGFFLESHNHRIFEKALGYQVNFVQDNHSRSAKGVLRGLHYQIQNAQGKLVRVIRGEVLDVAVDIRKSSPTFGKWVSAILNDENKNSLWIPEGFAHGFIVLSDEADFLYKTTNYYSPEYERCIAWNDGDLKIDWQFEGIPTLSDKDSKGASFKEADTYA